jgi:hypothetical protein
MRVEITLERVKITLCVLKSHSCTLKSLSSVFPEKLSVSYMKRMRVNFTNKRVIFTCLRVGLCVSVRHSIYYCVMSIKILDATNKYISFSSYIFQNTLFFNWRAKKAAKVNFCYTHQILANNYSKLKYYTL